MSAVGYFFVSIGLALLILFDLYLMSSPKTAVKGNGIGAAAILAAIVATLFYYQIVTLKILWVCLLVGAVIGLYLGGKVKMMQMPEMVAFLHGLGGCAAVLLSITVLLNPGEVTSFSTFTGMLALAVGGLTFSGSMVAASKLHQIISSRPVVFPGHTRISVLALVVMGILVLGSLFFPGTMALLIAVCLTVSLCFGYLFTIRVGGADMPITISLLNSCSGVTGAMVGLATYDPLLIAGGGIVAAAGYLLTEIMCRAMNRSLLEVLSGKTTAPNINRAKTDVLDDPKDDVPMPQVQEKKTAGQILAEAQRIIIVPGYGMALAQAQREVKQLADLLERRGKEVKYAIHPVAGRMPGHMNVLLAEVDVDYDQLFEMDAINASFKETDLALIVGANDVVNPAANTAEGTPIYGMPILNAYEAKNVIICNYDTKPGYAGVENPLYKSANSLLILGDAKETVGNLAGALAQMEPAPS
ncbi:NAD(P)(+) transhydrogenase (Re/Si-specific) subunit beta [Candidatus Formimonas warabiya]|uniref:proton-translocating NAD(P)(+) transhydrogenase n=1 Tax=Formimonas warabiya TaxID=1761012 RepID=A0A3G1KVW2_FORW1|nr:NAD(P)(+) transhydrogenase (Re/Si-specific) subunit beta [Candidatus Formimonas warabiya]ATW26527.1 NAD synthetase [Candidatus Formimonas warabiya]